MVFVVSVLNHLSIVDSIEEYHAAHHQLAKGSKSSFLRQHILVLPSPKGTRDCTRYSTNAATSQPTTNLTKLHLAKGCIRFAIKPGRVVGPVDLGVVFNRIVCESHVCDRPQFGKNLSSETFDYHYGKHHATYVTNLNNLVKGT